MSDQPNTNEHVKHLAAELDNVIDALQHDPETLHQTWTVLCEYAHARFDVLRVQRRIEDRMIERDQRYYASKADRYKIYETLKDD